MSSTNLDDHRGGTEQSGLFAQDQAHADELSDWDEDDEEFVVLLTTEDSAPLASSESQCGKPKRTKY